MVSNWKVAKTTLTWLLVAVMTLGLVVASPYLLNSSAASAPKTVTVAKAGGKWGAVKNGKIDTSVTGVYKNQYGWWYVKKGLVQFNYTGIQNNQYGWWRIENGKVNFNATGVYQNEYGWWRVENGKVNFGANSIYQNAYGWWKTTNGKVTFKENGVFKNPYGWWKVEKSKVNFNFNGLASNNNVLWYIENGKVDFNQNGIYEYNKKTYYIQNGKATEITERMAEAVIVAQQAIREVDCSRAVLIEVLQQEEIGFTKEEATYGVDHSGINFKTEVLLVADRYISGEDEDFPAVSRNMLEALLGEDWEEFTKEEVAYALKTLDDDKYDWNKQALSMANYILEEAKDDNKTLTKDDLKKILIEEFEFTEAQAAYGAEHAKL